MKVIILAWWESMTFENQFYTIIEHLGTDHHPHRVNNKQIEFMYNQKYKDEKAK